MRLFRSMLALAAVAILSGGSQALAEDALSTTGALTVLGNGLARDCSVAARAGHSQHRYEELCTLALQAELLSPRDFAATLVNRGVFKMRRGEWANARLDFSQAVNMRPQLAEAYVNRGAALVGLRRYSEGLIDLNRAIDMGVEEPEKAYFNRALAHEGLDDVRSAYLDFKKAEELSPAWEEPKKQLTRFTVRPAAR